MSREAIAIYFAGLLQGIVLVAFPAASTLLTNSETFNFSSTEYGSLFIPQALIAILAAALNPKLSKKFSAKHVFMWGLIANLISMGLLASSGMVMRHYWITYPILMLATASLGLGFGFVVPTLNAMTALLYSSNVSTALLLLNAFLGVGTALAPLFITIFVAWGLWWGLPLSLAILLSLLIFFSWPLKLPGGKFDFAIHNFKPQMRQIPARFALFALFALLYGILETLNGNWVGIYLQKYLQAPLELQSYALMAFWGMVTLGRIFFAVFGKSFRAELTLQISPWIIAIALVFIASLSSGAETSILFAFGLAGFGCSALLPLILSLGSQQLKTMASSVPGALISCYLLGYGIAAFGVGPLLELTNISLSTIYAMGAGAAATLGVIALGIVKGYSCKTKGEHDELEG